MTTDPAYYLSIYIHAHKTGNSVPPRIEAEAIAALKAKPEPVERPIWTEGVCGDGAAILKDGVMQPIEDVIAALNAAELAQPEPVDLPPRVGHVLHLAEIIREVDGSHDKGASALAEAILSHPGSRWQPREAQPEPVGVTDEELIDCMIETAASTPTGQSFAILEWPDEAVALARAVLARYGRPAITPIPVIKRPWEREGFCDAEGRCWFSAQAVGGHYWHLWPRQKWLPGTGYCLPHWALPIPHQNPESK